MSIPSTPDLLTSVSAVLGAPLDRLARSSALDPAVERVAGVVQRLLPTGVAKDIAHGVPLGHPAHPPLAQAALGTLVSATVLAALPGSDEGRRRAGDLLTLLGVASAVPAAVTGWTDWYDGHPQQRRLGLVHAAGNGVGITLFAASLTGPRTWRRATRLIAGGVLGAAGAIGGHLAFHYASGANHAEDIPHLVPGGWHPIGALADLVDGVPTRAEVGGVGVVVVRQGQGADVLADRCSHLSAPLSEGSVSQERGAACIICPWHASTFRLVDGAVVHGPATAPVPVFEVRVREGEIEVRLPGADG